MRFVQATYDDALRFNAIIWNTYVARIVDSSIIPEFISTLQYALNESGIVLNEVQQQEFDAISDLSFFELNFADAMIYVRRLLSLIPPQLLFEVNKEFIYVPSLAAMGAIEYFFPFQDGTYNYLDVFLIPENNIVNILVDNIVSQSADDERISQEDRDFIHSLLNVPEQKK
jgi:hypothetical protein